MWRAAAAAVGSDGWTALMDACEAEGEFLKGARYAWTASNLGDGKFALEPTLVCPKPSPRPNQTLTSRADHER